MILTLDDGTALGGDEVLVAAGRTYNTDDLGLDPTGRRYASRRSNHPTSQT